MKAIKFGGTSMSTAASIDQVINIIRSDPERRFVVVSAPGKTDGESKVTDMLISVFNAGQDRINAFTHVTVRFDKLRSELGLPDGFFDSDFAEIIERLPDAGYDYIV